MKTLILSVWHNWAKSPKWAIDKWASANNTNEATETNLIINWLITKGIPWVKLIKVPLGLSLVDRIAWINKRFPKELEPFAFELHLDAWPITARGASVWFLDWNAYTKWEGGQFLQKYTEITWEPSRHVNPDTAGRWGRLWFVRDTKCASLLVELWFVTNTQDLKAIRLKAIDWIIEWVKNMNIK